MLTRTQSDIAGHNAFGDVTSRCGCGIPDGVRVVASCVAVVLCGACGQSAPPASLEPVQSPASSTVPTVVNPAKVARIRSELPAGYEVADLSGRASPIAVWGYRSNWVADPPQCGALADPAGDGFVSGWSGSGSGGIVYAVVADAPVGLDPALVRECGTWTLVGGHTSGVVTLTSAPAIDGAATLGLRTDSSTVVEGGTETHSHADTSIAYLGDHIAFVAVVTDPGSAGPALGPEVASELLVKTVSAIRG